MIALSAVRLVVRMLWLFAVCCKTFCLLALVAMLSPSLHAQTIDDGVMLTKGTLFTGVIYSRDTWDHYWEGTLKRTNGNIGTLSTQTAMWSGSYGLTDKLDIIAMVPYVWTHATQGVLHNMKGFQDFTLAGKYNALDVPFTKLGRLKVIGVLSGSIPMSNYTPDFMPLSIGSDSKRIATRATVNFQSNWGWFLNGSSSYTWRSNVYLARPNYFTNGQFFLTNQVEMPNVFDYTVSGGYMKKGWMIPFTFTQQRTQGGGDIRRQDMPFVSNRMNFSKIGVMAMIPLPRITNLAYQFSYGYVIDGRNVGQSTTISTGFLYRFNFSGRPTQ
jgi:hypothetical protein